MVFLTSVDILDTGFLTVNRDPALGDRQTQLLTTQRVNSGISLGLKGVEVDIGASANLDKSGCLNNVPSTPNFYGDQHALISINPTTISITILLNSNNTNTTNYYETNDMSYLPMILQLCWTRGFKAVYYPVDITAVDTGGNSSRAMAKQITYVLGAADTTQSQGDLATNGNKVVLWTGATATGTGKDLTDVKYIACRFDSADIVQVPNNMIKVKLNGVITA